MKFVLALGIFLALIFIPLYPVYAVESSTSGTTATRSGNLTVRDRLLNQKENAIEKRETQKDRLASASAALKAKLKTFKNKDKAILVEKINEYFGIINKKATDNMNMRLDKMGEILAKLEGRIASSSATDKTDAEAAAQDARDAIANAEAAVTTQSQNVYIIKISSESAAKADAMTTRTQLRTDLIATNELVKQARRSLSDAISIAASTLGGIGNGQ